MIRSTLHIAVLCVSLTACTTTKPSGLKVTGPEPGRTILEANIRDLAALNGVSVGGVRVEFIHGGVNAGLDAQATSIGGKLHMVRSQRNDESDFMHRTMRHEALHIVLKRITGDPDFNHEQKSLARAMNVWRWR